MTKTIKIMLADDHGITRDGLKALLVKEPGMQVVAEAGNGREAVRLASRYEPDVVVMDINMPELNGIEATRQIKAAMPRVKVIALSMFSERRYVTRMLKVGVSGYLLKHSAFEELALAIRAVMRGEGYLSQKIAHILMEGYADNMDGNDESCLSSLTSREMEVLQLLAEGLGTKDVADRMCVSVKTVSTHRSRVMEKLKADSIAALTKIAIREGLVSL